MIKTSLPRKAFQIFNGFIMFLIVLVCLYPVLYVLAISLSSTSAVVYNKVSIVPVGFNLDSYVKIFHHPSVLTGYRNTLVYTVVGTVLSLILTILCAYPLSKDKFFGKTVLTKLMVFTMFFGGGMIPNYLVVKELGLIDTIWAIVLPASINTYYMIIMLTFFKGIPESLLESGEIDGMNPIQALLYIVVPLSKPVIATLVLFYAVDYWNDWFHAMLYINSSDKVPMMLILRNIVMGAEMAARDTTSVRFEGIESVAQTTRSAAIIVTILPILVVYPFVQKYFVKGVMIGAVKG